MNRNRINPARRRLARKRPAMRRGVALLLAVFALVVVGTTTAAYVASRDTSVMVARNAQGAADARSLAAAGMSVVAQILRNGDSEWRTEHTNGRLLNAYALDEGTVTVDLVDIERREAGEPNPVPNGETTEVEVTVTSNRNGSTWVTTSNMSIPSVAYGQYAVFVERYLNVSGTRNFFGRWPNSPMAEQRLRVNMATASRTAAISAVTRIASTGFYLGSGATFEAKVAGVNKADPDTLKPAWVYYPNDGSKLVVQGASADKVATKIMEASKTVAMAAVPDPPAVTTGATRYTADFRVSGSTATYSPFQVKAAIAPALTPLEFEVKDSSVITLTSGTYEIWGTWELKDSRVIIQGDVKVVMLPCALRAGLDWANSSVEVNASSSLEIYIAYGAMIRDCWIGSRYVCADEKDAALAEGDPHRKVWMSTFSPSACFPSAPTHPLYMQPWKIRFYPVKSVLSSASTWEVRDSSVIGSFFVPTNTLRVCGRSRIYGRTASRDLSVEDTASFYYDHMLDEVSGLTEGTSPERGGDADQMYPVRVIRYGFDAETAR